MAGITDQLRIKDARARPPGGIWRKDGDHRPDVSAIGGLVQMRCALGRNLVGGAHLPPVPNSQRTPVQPADTARAVAPCDTGGESEFLGSMPVSPVRFHLAADLLHAGA